MYGCRFAGCPKMFVQATPRNDHEAASHLGILPYVCGVCAKAFPSKRNLNRHGGGVHRTRAGALRFHIIATAELRTAALAAEQRELAARARLARSFYAAAPQHHAQPGSVKV
jgi:hypothetical protein